MSLKPDKKNKTISVTLKVEVHLFVSNISPVALLQTEEAIFIHHHVEDVVKHY